MNDFLRLPSSLSPFFPCFPPTTRLVTPPFPCYLLLLVPHTEVFLTLGLSLLKHDLYLACDVAENTVLMVIDKMFSAGVNVNGLLGIGETSETEATDTPVVITTIEDDAAPPSLLVDSWCGDSHHLVVDDNGDIWGWGEDDTGSLGGVSPNAPERLTLSGTGQGSDEKVVRVAGISTGTTFWVTVDDTEQHSIYCAGTDYASQCPSSAALPAGGEDGPVSHMSSYISNMLITFEGSNGIWQIGTVNFDGRLGNGGTSGYSSLTRNPEWDSVTSGKTLQFARAGLKNTYVKLTNGEFWVSGAAARLGLGPDQSDAESPTRMTSVPADWVDLSAETHVLALDSNGGVWSWGTNGAGELGVSDTTDRDVPTLISFFTNSGVNVTAVQAATSSSLAVDNAGFLYTWGSNGNGHLGVGPPPSSGSPDVLVPTKVSFFQNINLSVTKLSCLSESSMFVMTSNEPPESNTFNEYATIIIVAVALGGTLFSLFALSTFCNRIDSAINDSVFEDEEE